MLDEDAPACAATAQVRSAWTAPEAVAFPELRALVITSSCPKAPVAIAAAALATPPPSLTRLSLRHVHTADCDFLGKSNESVDARRGLRTAPAGGPERRRAWSEFIPRLGACMALMHLDLVGLVGPGSSEADGVEGQKGGEGMTVAGALRNLPRLTRLELTAKCARCSGGDLFPFTVHGGGLAAALRGLTALRALAVRGAAFMIVVSCVDDLLAALPELPALAELSLCFPGLHRAHVVKLLPQLPSLKSCEVFEAVAGVNEAEKVAFRGEFPGLEIVLQQWDGMPSQS